MCSPCAVVVDNVLAVLWVKLSVVQPLIWSTCNMGLKLLYSYGIPQSVLYLNENSH